MHVIRQNKHCYETDGPASMILNRIKEESERGRRTVALIGIGVKFNQTLPKFSVEVDMILHIHYQDWQNLIKFRRSYSLQWFRINQDLV